MKDKFKIAMVFCSLVLILGTTIFFIGETRSANAQEVIKVNVDGNVLNTDVSPQLINNSTFVPMRSIFEALNADVVWNEKEQSVQATKGSIKLKIYVGNQNYGLNGRNGLLGNAPYVLNGRVMVPIRFVSESLNANVGWDGTTNMVTINSMPGMAGTTPTTSPTLVTPTNNGGLLIVVDGEKVNFVNKPMLYQEDYEKAAGNLPYVIAPIGEYAKATFDYCELENAGKNLLVKTNFDTFNYYEGGGYGQYTGFIPDKSMRVFKDINGVKYTDIESMADLFGQDYSYDRGTNTVYITTLDKRVQPLLNNSNVFVVNSLEEALDKAFNFLIRDTSDTDTLYFYPKFVLGGTYKDGSDLFQALTGGNGYRYLLHDVGLIMKYTEDRDTSNNNGNRLYAINVNHYYYKGETTSMNSQVNEKVKSVVAKLITKGMSDREKVAVLNDYVVANCSIDNRFEDKNVFGEYDNGDYSEHDHFAAYNPYGCAVLGKGLCASYSGYLIRLLNVAGVKARMVEGTVDGGGHGWVKVKIDGKWLLVDPIFNDHGNNRAYFLMTDQEISRDHIINEEIEGLKCSD